MEKTDTDEEQEKEKLFQECYGLINQDRVPVAATALSMVDTFTLREFMEFCNSQDEKQGKQKSTSSKFYKKCAEVAGYGD